MYFTNIFTPSPAQINAWTPKVSAPLPALPGFLSTPAQWKQRGIPLPIGFKRVGGNLRLIKHTNRMGRDRFYADMRRKGILTNNVYSRPL